MKDIKNVKYEQRKTILRVTNIRKSHYKLLIKRYKKIQMKKFIAGNILNSLTFTVPDSCIPVKDKGNWLNRLKRRLKYLLNKNGFYNFVLVFHWWGDRNPMKTNIHFHILAKSKIRKLSEERLAKMRKDWAKVLKYPGKVDIYYHYFYLYRRGLNGAGAARHYYNYLVRPYVYDVFLWWLQGYNVNGWQDALSIWYPRNAVKIRWYGKLTFSIAPTRNLGVEWESMGLVDFLRYERDNDMLYAWFYWEQEFLKFKIPVSGGFI